MELKSLVMAHAVGLYNTEVILQYTGAYDSLGLHGTHAVTIYIFIVMANIIRDSYPI